MTSVLINDILIRPLQKSESIPYDLLLLADPSKDLIDGYISFSAVYVIELSESIIGVYILYPVNSHTAEIKNIVVAPAHQGRGIGKLLIAHAMQTAVNKGFKTIIIGTANSSVGQLYLYQKQGFEIFEIKKDYFIKNYPVPIYENGIQAKHMIMLAKQLM